MITAAPAHHGAALKEGGYNLAKRPKQAARKRHKSFRFNDEELEIFYRRAKAHGVAPAKFARAMLLDSPVKKSRAKGQNPDPFAPINSADMAYLAGLRALTEQIRRVGVNLSQHVKAMNMKAFITGREPEPSDISHLVVEIKELVQRAKAYDSAYQNR